MTQPDDTPMADEWAELENVARAFGPEEWRARENDVVLVHEGGTIRIAETDPFTEFEEDHAARIALFIAAANPEAVLKLIAAARLAASPPLAEGGREQMRVRAARIIDEEGYILAAWDDPTGVAVRRWQDALAKADAILALSLQGN